MIFQRLRLINKNQLGFTLVELMLAIAVGGIVTGGITATIFQVVDHSSRTNNHMIAVREAQEAGYFVSHDAVMAQVVEPADESVDDPDGTGFPLTLTWTEWDSAVVHQVVYSLVASGLQQSHTYNGTSETSIVAEFIDWSEKDGVPQTKCEFTGSKLTLTVTATVGSGSRAQTETRVYEIVPRPGSQ